MSDESVDQSTTPSRATEPEAQRDASEDVAATAGPESDVSAEPTSQSLAAEPVAKKGLVTWIAVAAAIVIVAAAAFWFLYLGKTAVPDLKGQTVAQATEALREVGLKAGDATYDEQASGAAGAIVGQDPAAGKRVDDGAVVNLVVAGPPPVQTPDLAGIDGASVEAALEVVGLRLGDVSEAYHQEVPEGGVVSQTPAASAETPDGSAVDVVISMGPEPVPVPDVVGKAEAEAGTTLRSAGFKVEATAKDDKAAKGTVLIQEPGAGKELQPGQTVKLTVSTGVVMVRVPNVYGRIDADDVIRAAGLVPVSVPIHGPIESDCAGYMEAYRQSPKAGSYVPKGSKVTYRFWWETG